MKMSNELEDLHPASLPSHKDKTEETRTVPEAGGQVGGSQSESGGVAEA